jgi:hypothetical protein
MKLYLGLATIASTLLVLFTPQLGRSQNIFPQPMPGQSPPPIDREQKIFVPPVPARSIVPIDRGQGAFGQPFPASSYPTTPIDRPVPIENNGAMIILRGYANDNPNTTTIIDPFAPIDPNSSVVPGSIDLIQYTNNYPNGRYVPPAPAPVISPDRQLDPRGARYACSNTIIGVPSATPSAINRYTGQPCR